MAVGELQAGIEVEKTEEMSIGKLIINKVSGIFLPIINILMATAMLKGVLSLLVSLQIISTTDGLYELLYAASDGFFYFLPIFLAYTASKQFSSDSFVAMVIGGALLYPNIMTRLASEESLIFLGMRVQPINYASSVIPIILAVVFLHYIEKPLDKYLPEFIKGFLKPTICIVLTVPITFLCFGPIGVMVGDVLARGFFILYDFNPIVAGAFLGFIIQPMVVVGCHWSIVPVCIANIMNYGGDPILPLMGAAVLAQGGAALAVGLMYQNQEDKRVAFSAALVAVLGISEPAIFGVNLKLGRPMLTACIAGGIGGGIVGSSGSQAISFAFPSFATAIVYVGKGFGMFILSMIIGFGAGFILTMMQRKAILKKIDCLN